jgi:hypothetical protein
MSVQANGQVRLELRDGGGNLVQVFVPQQDVEALRAERDDLRRQVEQLQAQLATARKVQADLQAERDEYGQALAAISEDRDLAFDRKQLEALRQHGVPFETIIQEVEQIVRAKPAGT